MAWPCPAEIAGGGVHPNGGHSQRSLWWWGHARPESRCQAARRRAGRPRGAAGAKELTGAGATFPYPLYSKWFDVYNQATGVRINYQSIGSGGGIRQLIEKTVDFGASDAPMTDDQIKAAGGAVLHIPTVLGRGGYLQHSWH